MPRYIDADLIEPSEIIIPCGDGTYEYAEVVYMDDIREIPTADVVEVVRCKDCEHLSNDRIAPEWHRRCRKYGCGKADDGFCDEGERREDERH